MKLFSTILIVLAGLYLVAFLIDVFTIPTTTPGEITRAHQYVDHEELPMPPREFYEDGCTA